MFFKNNLIFSLPLYFSIMYLINPTNYLNPSLSSILTADVDNAFIATIAIIPGYLLSLRLLAHPTQIKCRIPLLGRLLKEIRDQYSTTKSTETLKERFLSFYFSLSASAFFFMMMLYLYKLMPIKMNPFDLSIYVFQSINKSFVPNYDTDPGINAIRITFYIGGFIFALFLTTFLGEYILHNYRLLDKKT